MVHLHLVTCEPVVALTPPIFEESSELLALQLITDNTDL